MTRLCAVALLWSSLWALTSCGAERAPDPQDPIAATTAALSGAVTSCGVSLTATLYFHGTETVDGTATLSQPMPFRVPASIPISVGGTKNGKAQLQFSQGGGSTITCNYVLHGGGSNFPLSGCDNGAVAGTAESADTFVLHIQNADHGAGTSGDSIQLTLVLEAPGGTACSGTNACEQTYACQSGVCVGSNAVTCTASDSCHLAGTCDPSTGICSNPSAPDGTSCNGGGGTGSCQGGTCVAGCGTPSLSVPDMPTARFVLAAVRGSDGRLYAISGSAGSGNLSDVDVYDPCTNKWSTVAPIPTPRYAAAAAVGPDGRIYVIGGQGDPNQIATVEAYNPTTNDWSTVAPMPTPRGSLGAATGSDGRIYAVGGYPGGGAPTNVVEAYDTTLNQWSTVAPMSTARLALGVAADANGIVYAIGGGDFVCNVFASVEAYDPATNQWTSRPSLPSPVYLHSVALGPDDRIYSFGGEVGSGCQTGAETNLFIYDPNADFWTSGASMPAAVRAAAAASGAGSGALLYVFGGGAGGPALATVQAYDPVANVW